MLLEKAWAKVYTSYRRTEGGSPQEPLHDLTGAPIKYISTKSSDKDEEWNYLYKASQLDYSMVCSSPDGSDTNKSPSGVVLGHAYTLLKVDILNFKGQQVKLVQLRNPWGKGEFNGDWSDYDSDWNKIEQKEK
jgi:calpain-15